MTLDQHRAAGSIVSRWTVTFVNTDGVRVPFFGTSVTRSHTHKYQANEAMRKLFCDEENKPLIAALPLDAARSIRTDRIEYWRGYHALEVQG